MSPFRHRWFQADGDLRCQFWSVTLIAKRLARGQDSAGRTLIKCPIGRILF